MLSKQDISAKVTEIINKTQIIDVHTHLFPSEFKNLSLWGPDELITYHYLIAEAIKATNIPYNDFWEKSKREQADFIFENLFIKRTPLSEATRGVLTVFSELGIDLSAGNLQSARKKYNEFNLSDFTDFVFEKANIKSLVMTNDIFDDYEYHLWTSDIKFDKRFKTAMRLDVLLNDYNAARYHLLEAGYDVGRTLNGIAKREIRRFISEKIDMLGALYVAVSLPPEFSEPMDDLRNILLEDCVFPVCFEKNVPIALMIGVKRRINPDLDLAGDSVGKSNIEAVEFLCRKFYRNKFMVTMLSRENQHELCVAARKFPNLFLFGCWWFMNTPSMIEEMTKMRLELLGTSFMPQHSDARVMDQLIYKWKHSKKVIAKVLTEKYEDLYDCGWLIEDETIRRDVEKLFGGNFEDFLKLEL